MILALIQENDLRSLGIACVVGLISFLCLRTGLAWLGRRLQDLHEGQAGGWKGIVGNALIATHALPLIGVSLYLVSINLVVSSKMEALLVHILIVAVVLQLGLWGNRAIWQWMEQRSTQMASHGDTASLSSLNVFKVMAQIVLWVTIILLLLDNLGFNVGALVTSLGIGGVAVALAIQNILGDLFASLSIALDKPFVVGDAIQVGDDSGTVKRIGLKTTRVQSVSGEELIFSNSDLLRSRVRNFGRMAQRRIAFTVGVTYDVTQSQIESINGIIRESIQAQAKTKFDRVHFKQFSASSLDFEAVYHMLDQDYLCYMDAQQAINVAILARFNAEGINFAYPSQTLYVASLPAGAEAPH